MKVQSFKTPELSKFHRIHTAYKTISKKQHSQNRESFVNDTKVDINGAVHIIKMTATPVFGKNFQISIIAPMPLLLGMCL